MSDSEVHSLSEPVDGYLRDGHWPKVVFGETVQEDRLVCGKHPERDWLLAHGQPTEVRYQHEPIPLKED